MSPGRIAVVCATLALGPAPRLSAQVWSVDAYLGRSLHEALAGDQGSANAVIGLRYAGAPGTWLYLAGAAPLGAEDPVWSAAGAGTQLVLRSGGVAAGLELAGHGHVYRDGSSGLTGTGGTLELRPVVSARTGPARVEVRSGWLHHEAALSGATASRGVLGTDARLSLQVAAGLEVSAEARHMSAAEGDYPYAGGAVALDRGRVGVWASGGRWFSEVISTPMLAGGLALRVGERTQAWTALRQDPSDPLRWNETRRSWSVGASVTLGGARRRIEEVVPVGRRGATVIRLPVSETGDAAPPAVAGEFSGWEPISMARRGSHWIAELSLEPGVYRYAFRAADGTWFVPASTPGRVPDDFGGFTAILIVR